MRLVVKRESKFLWQRYVVNKLRKWCKARGKGCHGNK
jgi:hypothetical protein